MATDDEIIRARLLNARLTKKDKTCPNCDYFGEVVFSSNSFATSFAVLVIIIFGLLFFAAFSDDGSSSVIFSLAIVSLITEKYLYIAIPVIIFYVFGMFYFDKYECPECGRIASRKQFS